jgi:hypothetical protein
MIKKTSEIFTHQVFLCLFLCECVRGFVDIAKGSCGVMLSALYSTRVGIALECLVRYVTEEHISLNLLLDEPAGGETLPT